MKVGKIMRNIAVKINKIAPAVDCCRQGMHKVDEPIAHLSGTVGNEYHRAVHLSVLNTTRNIMCRKHTTAMPMPQLR